MAIHPIYKKPSYLSTGGHLPSILSTVAILKLSQVAIIPVNKWPSFPVYYCPPFLSTNGHHTLSTIAHPSYPHTDVIEHFYIFPRGPSDNLSQLDLSLPKICPKPEAGDGHKMWITLPTWLLHVEPPLFPESKFLWHTSNRRQGNTLESWIPIILWFCMQYQVWNTEDILLDLFRTIS